MRPGRGGAGGDRPGGRADRGRRGEPMPGAREVIDLCRRAVDPDGRVLGLLRRGHRGRARPAGDQRRRCRRGTRPSGSRWASPTPVPTCPPRPSSASTPRRAWPSRTRSTGPSRPRRPGCGWCAVPEPAAQGSPRWGFCDLVLASLAGFDGAALDALEGGPAGPDAARTRPPRQRRRRTGPAVPGAEGPGTTGPLVGIGCGRLQNADPASVAPHPPPMNTSRGAVPRAGGTRRRRTRSGGQAGRAACRLPSLECDPGRARARSGGPSGLDRTPGGAGSVRPWAPDRHVTTTPSPVRIGVLASGSGTILEAILADGPARPRRRGRPSVPGPRGGRRRRPCRRCWSTGPTTAGSAPGSTGAAYTRARDRRPGGRRRRRRGDGRLRHRARPARPRRLPGPHPEHPPGPAAGVPGLARRARRPGRRRGRDGHHRPRGPPGDGHRADPGPGHGGRSCRTTPRPALHERIKAVERTLYPATIRAFIDDLASRRVGGGPSPEEVTE